MTRHGRPPSFTKAQRYEVAITYGAVVLCQGCGYAIYVKEMQIDHHLAWIDGGPHELLNWQPLCFPCHAKKSAREHKSNAKSKRVNAKHFGTQPDKPKRRLQGGNSLRGRSRPFPKCDNPPPLPSSKFPKRYRPEAAE